MDYPAALQFLQQNINSQHNYTIHQKKQAVKRALNGVQNNYQNVDLYQIVGSKGKSSITSYISQVLVKARARLAQKNVSNVGTFTSPHVLSFRERVQLNNKNISPQDFGKLVGTLRNQGFQLPPFQTSFLTGMRYFSNNNVNQMVVEAGIGGISDVTSVLNDYDFRSKTVVLGHVELEHQNKLGNTVEDIFYDKLQMADRNTSRLVVCRDVLAMVPTARREIQNIQKQNSGLDVRVSTRWGPDSCTELALLAVAPENARVSQQDIDDCKKWLVAPHARQEVIQLSSGRQLFVDGAHTADSLRETSIWFANQNRTNDRERVLLFGVTKDRDYRKFLQVLNAKNQFTRVFAIPGSNVLDLCAQPITFAQCDVATAEQIASYVQTELGLQASALTDFQSIQNELTSVVQERNTALLCTGSLHVCGVVLKALGFH